MRSLWSEKYYELNSGNVKCQDDATQKGILNEVQKIKYKKSETNKKLN